MLLQGSSRHFHVELVDSAEDDVGLSEPSTESVKLVWTISQEYITELIVGMLSSKPVKVHRNVSQNRTLQKPVDQAVDVPVLGRQEERGINGPSSNMSTCRRPLSERIAEEIVDVSVLEKSMEAVPFVPQQSGKQMASSTSGPGERLRLTSETLFL